MGFDAGQDCGAGHDDPGEVTLLARRIVRAMEDYHLLRVRLLRDHLFGRDLGMSEARMAVVRLVVLEWCDGRELPASACVVRLRRYASPAKLRDEIRLLSETGVVAVERLRDGSRQSLLRPTARLVRYLNERMPEVRDFVVGVARDCLALSSQDPAK